jgi:hypothetical protein
MNAERIRAAIRRHPALWGDMGPEKEQQASRILAKTADRLRPSWRARAADVAHAKSERMLRMWA